MILNLAEAVARLKPSGVGPSICTFRLRTGRGVKPADLVEDLDRAVSVANEQGGLDRQGWPWGSAVCPSKPGVTATLIKRGLSKQDIADWFAALSDALGDLDVTLTSFRPPRDFDLDNWLRDPAPTAFLFLAVDKETNSAHDIPAELLDDAIGWCVAAPEPKTDVFTAMVRFPARAENLKALARHALAADPYLTMHHHRAERPWRGRQVDVEAVHGLVMVQAFDAAAPMLDAFDAVCEVLRQVGRHVDYAFVQPSSAAHPALSTQRIALGRLPTWEENRTGINGRSSIWGDHVVGTYAAQVLTERHLSRLDMVEFSGFETEELGAGRVLVRAVDPEPWLPDNLPERGSPGDVLAALRPPRPAG